MKNEEMDLATRITTVFLFISFSICIVVPRDSSATNYHGRATLGVYQGLESFYEDSYDSKTNDVLVASSRLYLSLSNLFSSDWEAVIDFRDKHDFFDKLEREKQSLTDRNDFQVKQLFVKRSPKRSGIEMHLGRFVLLENGGSFIDGIRAGYRLPNRLGLSVFAGNDAQPIGENYASWNPENQIFGAFVSYDSLPSNRTKYVFSTLSYTEQMINNMMSRRYAHHSLLWQWARASYLSSALTADTFPRENLQHANVSLNHRWNRRLRSRINASTIDTIEYEKQQDLLEELEPSRYSEARVQQEVRWGRRLYSKASYRYGVRLNDKKLRQELAIKLRMPQLFAKNWEFFFVGAYKDRFTKYGPTLAGGLGYFTRKWESSLEYEALQERRSDGSEQIASIAELSLSYVFNRQLFMTLFFQRAQDENVEINSAFFKISYRFGNRGTAPIRDGSPPRGRL